MRKILVILGFFLVMPFWVQAETRHPSFITPKGLQPRVNFWINIFTRYGDHHEVLHHRAYPQVVFKVLDFYRASTKLSERALNKLKQAEIKRNTTIIKQAVQNLASGAAPRSDLEKHIAYQMAFLGAGTDKYRELLQDDMIRSQRGIKERYFDAMQRSALYMPHIEKIFRSEGLPIELTRLPFVESSFNYSARSAVGAAGIWQFMPQTARYYKMMVNNIVDERLDVFDASRAAASYLKHAYEVLESWPLAVTSYNHGITGVARKVKTLGTRDITSIVEHRTQRLLGFASNNFYPELLAAITIYEQKHHYFPHLKMPAAIQYTEYRLPHPATVGYLAQQLHTSVHELMPLNYALLSPIWTGRYRIPQGYNLKLPARSAKYVNNLSKEQPYQVGTSSVYGTNSYKVRSGDTLISLARKFNLTVAQIKKLNNLNSTILKVGQVLVVKHSEMARNTRQYQVTPSSSYHVVSQGNTISSIAKRYGVSVTDLKRANHLRSDIVMIGQKLIIPSYAHTSNNYVHQKTQIETTWGGDSGEYVVGRGDTLYSIARKNNLSVVELKRANNLSSNVIKFGQKLKIPSTNPSLKINHSSVHVSSPRTYVVRAGDTYWGIANKFRVSVSSLQRANAGKKVYIKAGDKLVIP